MNKTRQELKLLSLDCSMVLAPTVAASYYVEALNDEATTEVRTELALAFRDENEFMGAWR